MSSGGGGEYSEDEMIWIYETWGLQTQQKTVYKYADADKLHSRVMVRDTEAGYHTTATTFDVRSVFRDVDADIFLAKMAKTYPEYSTASEYIVGLYAKNDDVGNTVIIAYTNDEHEIEIGRGWVTDHQFQSIMESWGININPSPNYGTIVYYVDDTYTTTASVIIPELEAIHDLGGAGQTIVADWEADIAGIHIPNKRIKSVTLTSLVNYLPISFLSGCNHLESLDIAEIKVDKIPEVFLRGCSMLNSPIVIPRTVTEIGAFFMNSCTAFNSPLTLPSGLQSIGFDFMVRCTSFNQPLTLPNLITSIGVLFMYECQSMTSPITVGTLDASVASSSISSFATLSSSAACYTTGIPIKGSNRSTWLSRFSNSSSIPYRKLTDGGA